MKTLTYHALCIGSTVALLGAPIAIAQSSPPPGQGSQSNTGSGNTVRGSKVVGAKLFTTKGEQMGTIDDVLLDPKSGQISYGVLGIGGFLGMGQKKIIVPWNLIQQDTQNPENYVTSVDKQNLQKAPNFEGEDQWAMVTQPGFLKNVQSHFASAGQGGQQAQPQQPQQAQQQAQQEAQKREREQAQQQVQSAQKKVQDAENSLNQAKQQAQQAQQKAQQQGGAQVSTPPPGQ